MASVPLEEKQVVEFVQQLAPDRRAKLLRRLLTSVWPGWTEDADYAEERARSAAQKRGRDWDRMNEAEREAFIDEVIHENDPR